MCFSAEASFISGAVLTTVGIVAISKTVSRSLIPFASIPLIFAVQQFVEGIIWLSLSNPKYEPWHQISTYIFLTFALLIWPWWISFTVLVHEKEKKRKKMLSVLLALGIFVAIYIAKILIANKNVHSTIMEHHIYYYMDISTSKVHVIGILYVIATVLPLFLSSFSTKKMWFLGFLIFNSYVVSKLFFENYVISVWCFLSAIISMVILSIVIDIRNHSAINEKSNI